MAGRSPIVAFVLMLVAGLVIGLWSAGRVLGSRTAPGATSHGPWVAWHKAGGADADPYSLAAFARRGDVPMAPGEGLALFAARDSDGGRLRTACRYELRGAFPPSRAWTLTAYRADGRLAASPSGRTGFTSAEALVEDGAIAIALSPEPASGNWLPLAGDEPMILALRFYDTALSAAGAAIDDGRLPVIRRLGCP
jgi:hypothetical protein